MRPTVLRPAAPVQGGAFLSDPCGGLDLECMGTIHCRQNSMDSRIGDGESSPRIGETWIVQECRVRQRFEERDYVLLLLL